MTRHDADMTRLGQWWQRARRAGHTYAQALTLYRASPERYKRRELRSTMVWGVALPVLIVLGALVTPWLGLLLVLAYPLQVVRLHLRGAPLTETFFLMLGKLPETQGALEYWLFQRKTLIEYK